MTTAAERAARAKRAREDGNRAAASKPARAKSKPDAVVPDTVERQSEAALTALAEAELKRAAIAAKPNVVPKTSRATTKADTARVAAQRKPAARATSTAKPAAPVKVEDAVRAMDLTHVQCRDFGHSWRPFTARWIPAYNQYESQLICARCNTLRTRFLSSSGEQLSGGYDYAEGYLVKGLGRLTGTDRDVIRLASIQAVLVEDTAS